MSKKGNRYPEEFKKKAIAYSQQPGNTIASAAKKFEISDQTLRNWMKSMGEKKPAARLKVVQLEKELKETKRRLEGLELTNEILIKATAIFAASKQ
ncbi:MAG: hypothetical protein H6Q76_1649 [Firmicutes bacterium]|nr:hypothetical protein [Bacillota bacterium]